MKILYSFNKRGSEAEFWTREIGGASDERHQFIPFNHDRYVDVNLYVRAQLLDNLYYARHSGLMEMYRDFGKMLDEHKPDAVIVDNGMPYHPEFLRNVPIYKVLRTSDGPLTAYERDFAYVHAYDHILYHSPAYSRDLSMPEKLAYVGAKRADFWPFAAFDAAFDTSKTEETILAGERDIDVIFIGFPYRGKLPVFAKIKKALGKRVTMVGFSLKYNVYFQAKYGFPGWVQSAIKPGQEYIDLYQRAKIGFNAHNRGDYTVGSYRLFELPANGVMQISDGGPYLNDFFEVGKEIERYSEVDELIDKIRYYLAHDDERREIALNGYRRAMTDHRMKKRMRQAGDLIERALNDRRA
ncbi:MAG TPA: glycosyltransferase [Thermoanaerobaculia bacterium]|nr:glycosyltransferase [Thermoanaerobaculia bacterium]